MVIDLQLILEFEDIRPVSVNDSYRPTVSAPDSNGKRHAFLRSSYELMEFQDKIDPMLKEKENQIKQFVNDCKKQYPDYLGFKTTIVVGLPYFDLYYKRKSDLRPNDTSNFIKPIEDRVAVILGIDDKYTMEVRGIKYLSDNDKWKVIVIMEPINYKQYTESYIKEVLLNER